MPQPQVEHLAKDRTKGHGKHHSHSQDKIPQRFWPQSMTGRMVLLFATGLLMAQSLSGLLYWRDRQLNTANTLMAALGSRVIAIATLLDMTPPDQYPIVLQALNDPLLRVEQTTTPPSPSPFSSRGASDIVQHSPRFRHPNRFQRLAQFQAYLAQSLAEPVTVAVQRSPHHPHPLPQQRFDAAMPLWPSDRQVIITIAKQTAPTPQWWVFTIPIGFGSRHSGPTFPVWLGITGLGIWLLAVWGTHRITAPLLQFAAAADRLGIDVNAPPLPENGSQELRQAAQAFNQMQARLQRLISDRTLMLAALSHDLRTVLTRLRLRAEFIDDPVQQQKAQSDLSQMEMMLNSTLAFAKEDNTPEPRTSLDLSSLLQSICDDLTDSGHRVDYGESDRLILQGQPTALRRAFTNVIENAAIYGQIAMVTVSTYPDRVEVAIADQGPGIPPDLREDVFKPFFRLEQSRNRATGGTGLGLAVARTVIRRHGGNIELRDRLPASPLSQTEPGLLVIVQLPIESTQSHF